MIANTTIDNVLYQVTAGILVAAAGFSARHVYRSVQRTQTGKFLDYIKLRAMRLQNPGFRGADTLVRWNAGSPRIKHHLGNPSGTSSWACEPEQGKGYMSYGPYVRLRPGRYKAEFAMEIQTPTQPLPGPLLYVDATTEDPDSRQVGTVEVSRRFIEHAEVGGRNLNTYAIHFALEQIVQAAEFRVYTYGKTNICFRHVTLSTDNSILQVRYGPGMPYSSTPAL